MASIFDPECGAPAYLRDESVSLRCGGYRGIITGTIVGGIVCALINAQHSFAKLWVRILLGAASLFSIVLLFWFVGGFLGKRAQQVGKTEIDSYKKSGMSEQEAVRNVQNLQNNQRTSNSILAAGSMMATGLLTR